MTELGSWAKFGVVDGLISGSASYIVALSIVILLAPALSVLLLGFGWLTIPLIAFVHLISWTVIGLFYGVLSKVIGGMHPFWQIVAIKLIVGLLLLSVIAPLNIGSLLVYVIIAWFDVQVFKVFKWELPMKQVCKT